MFTYFIILFFTESKDWHLIRIANFNPDPPEPRNAKPLQAVQIQISWLCLSFSMWIYISNLDQVVQLADN